VAKQDTGRAVRAIIKRRPFGADTMQGFIA
jgi:hypothetical protein